ncbi:MAG: hypothetical protein KF860_17375 [Cyclobacteriaceae bacterium]|nr:hypothetical protein [Cyclobacteriaceae bacterium]
MRKPGKITYVLYPNERRAAGLFGDKAQHPIYIRLIHNRSPRYFKSYYFDLLSRPKYSTIGIKSEVLLEQVKEREEALLNFLVLKHKDSFDFDLFKKEYPFYAEDLLYRMEGYFLEYMVTFFADEGLPSISRTLYEGGKIDTCYSILNQLRSSLKESTYNKLIENAVWYGPPYIPIYKFAKQKNPNLVPVFSVKDWRNNVKKQELTEFIKSFHPAYAETFEDYIEKLLTLI